MEVVDDDREDEWFFSSVRRYKQIAMFNFDLRISHIDRTDLEHICIAGRKDTADKDDIVVLRLPGKLVENDSSNQSRLNKDNDLKIEGGGSSTSHLFQIYAVLNEQKLITSEEGKFGVLIYDIDSESNIVVTPLHEYPCNHLVPRFSFNGRNNILLTTTNKKPVAVMDISSGQFVENTCSERTANKEALLEPHFLTDNMYALCVKNSGILYINDVRCDKRIMVLSDNIKNGNNVWTATSLYQQLTGIEHQTATKIACASSEGHFVAYDFRNPKQPYCSADVSLDGTVSSIWDFSLQATKDFKRFSLSGCGGKVYVYDIDQCSLKLAFAHDGHIVEHHRSNNNVKCHMFLHDNMILSADNYTSLHCWQFVPVV